MTNQNQDKESPSKHKSSKNTEVALIIVDDNTKCGTPERVQYLHLHYIKTEINKELHT